MTAPTKHPFKRIEVPLHKFTEEVIPHHELSVAKCKNNVRKLLEHKENIAPLNREVQSIKRAVRQLKDLMYELDTLRAQVEDSDLDKFDSITLRCRKTILTITAEYNSLLKQIECVTAAAAVAAVKAQESRVNPFEDVGQIQIVENLDNLKLQQHENRLRDVENIENEIGDIHNIYQNLGQMVNEQRVGVDRVEANVESSLGNVQEGSRLLKACSKMKVATYPVTGAIIGTCLGGPIGFVAGLKFGGLAAVGFGVAGYTGGKMIKSYNCAEVDKDVNVEAVQNKEIAENVGSVNGEIR